MDNATSWAAITLVTALTVASRFTGPAMMARIAATPRIERFLNGLSVSVIAALVASIVAHNGAREAAAVGAAAVVMLVSKSAILAMIAGMAVAAAWAIVFAGGLAA